MSSRPRNAQDEFKDLSFDLSGNFPDLEIELER